MSERRAARRTHSKAGEHLYEGNELPPHLAGGPCIEDWGNYGNDANGWVWFRAMRNWQAAVAEWVQETGWAREGRPSVNARNLARCRRPWSRDMLKATGRRELLDYLEGRTPDPPPDADWNNLA